MRWMIEMKTEYLLINWGSIKTLDRNLMKISTFNTSQYNLLFMAYLITSADEGNFFYYSLEKKVENSNRLYEIRNTARKIMGHPTLTSVPVTRTVKENSVGRLHSLYWDGQEHLYSWGCRIWPQAIKRITKQKKRIGVAQITLKVRKISKLGDWIHSYMKILKQLWNNFILATFKTSDGGQVNLHNVSIDITFHEKYEAAAESCLIGSLEPYYRGLEIVINQGIKTSS